MVEIKLSDRSAAIKALRTTAEETGIDEFLYSQLATAHQSTLATKETKEIADQLLGYFHSALAKKYKQFKEGIQK